MYEYRVHFEGLPKTCWACHAETENYQWSSTNLKANTLEIGIQSCKEQTLTVNGNQHVFNDTSVIYCIAGIDGSTVSANPDTLVKTTTVAVQFPELVVDTRDLTVADYTNSPMLILPRVLDNCPEEFIAEIRHLLNSYISTHTVNSAESQMKCLSIFFQILAKIDNYVRNKFLKKSEKSHYYYVKKVNAIINKRYATKLSQQDVAKELGISASYLSSLYKRATGLNFSQYLLQTRINHAMQLLASSNLTTAQLAATVGFESEAHFRRRFKEYTGINVREYRYIQNEMTLYHAKPTRKKQNEEELP